MHPRRPKVLKQRGIAASGFFKGVGKNGQAVKRPFVVDAAGQPADASNFRCHARRQHTVWVDNVTQQRGLGLSFGVYSIGMHRVLDGSAATAFPTYEASNGLRDFARVWETKVTSKQGSERQVHEGGRVQEGHAGRFAETPNVAGGNPLVREFLGSPHDFLGHERADATDARTGEQPQLPASRFSM